MISDSTTVGRRISSRSSSDKSGLLEIPIFVDSVWKNVVSVILLMSPWFQFNWILVPGTVPSRRKAYGEMRWNVPPRKWENTKKQCLPYSTYSTVGRRLCVLALWNREKEESFSSLTLARDIWRERKKWDKCASLIGTKAKQHPRTKYFSCSMHDSLYDWASTG